jgi:hypothetical protein
LRCFTARGSGPPLSFEEQDHATVGRGELEGLVEDALEELLDVEHAPDVLVGLERDAQLLVVGADVGDIGGSWPRARTRDCDGRRPGGALESPSRG